MKGLKVWGMGNPLLGDDAAGCRVAELLLEKGMRNVVNCETTPENYLSELRRDPPRTLLVADAAQMGLVPGCCRRMSLSELDSVAQSSHGIPLALLLSPFADTIEIFALGIQPASLQLGAPLSEAVETAVRRIAGLIEQNRYLDIEPLYR